MNAFVLTSPLAGVMLLTRRQPFYPSAAHDKFYSICTAFGGYTKFGIAPIKCFLTRFFHDKGVFYLVERLYKKPSFFIKKTQNDSLCYGNLILMAANNHTLI